MLKKIGERKKLVNMVNNIGKEEILMRGKIERKEIDNRIRSISIEMKRKEEELWRWMKGRKEDKGEKKGKKILNMERIWKIVIRKRIDERKIVDKEIERGKNEKRYGEKDEKKEIKKDDKVNMRKEDIKKKRIIRLCIEKIVELLEVIGDVKEIKWGNNRLGKMEVKVIVVLKNKDKKEESIK